MVDTPTVHITDRELVERIVDSAADGKPLRVEAGGRTYVLAVECEEAEIEELAEPGDDKPTVAEVLDKYVGAWAHLDVDRMIMELYEAREKGSRPADRP